MTLSRVVMLDTGLRMGVNRDSPFPKLLGTSSIVGLSSSSTHARCLRSVEVQVITRDDTNAVILSVGLCVVY
jgi:hypothetical protein